MEQLRKFMRDKGFALALTACLVAAAAAGVWAVRTVRAELGAIPPARLPERGPRH